MKSNLFWLLYHGHRPRYYQTEPAPRIDRVLRRLSMRRRIFVREAYDIALRIADKCSGNPLYSAACRTRWRPGWFLWQGRMCGLQLDSYDRREREARQEGRPFCDIERYRIRQYAFLIKKEREASGNRRLIRDLKQLIKSKQGE